MAGSTLTGKDAEIVDVFRKRAADGLPPPSVREVCAAVGLRSSRTVHRRLRHLQGMGVLGQLAEGQARGFYLVGCTIPMLRSLWGIATADERREFLQEVSDGV